MVQLNEIDEDKRLDDLKRKSAAAVAAKLAEMGEDVADTQGVGQSLGQFISACVLPERFLCVQFKLSEKLCHDHEHPTI